MFDRGFRPRIIAALVVLALPACQSGGGASKLNLGLGAKQQPATEEVSERELRAFCPPLQIRSGTAFYEVYKGGEQSAKNVVYQASIDDVTRSCSYNADGTATMTVAVAGKVVSGPAGSPGKIDVPIRIAILRSGNVVDSKLYRYGVGIGDTSGATQFIYKNPSVVVPAPLDPSLQLFVGFDRGPQKNQ